MIRYATHSDIDVLLELTKACTKQMADHGIFQWNNYYPNKIAFENDINRNELYVLEHHGKIIGCVVISTYMDKEYLPIEWLTENKNNVYIHRLAVHPNQQGKGLARYLMDFAETTSRENHKISVRLDTFSQNHRNQKFHELRGYERLGNIYFTNQSEFPFYCYELIL